MTLGYLQCYGLPDVIRKTYRELRASDGYDSYKGHDVRPACCAAYVYSDAYLRSGVDRTYVLALSIMMRKRFALPMTVSFDKNDPESVVALAERWREVYVKQSDR